MSFSVVTNLSALNSQAQLEKTGLGLQQTLARLTSGLRINNSGDDAAGLAIANRFRMDNAGLTTGIRSANDAISRLQSAELEASVNVEGLAPGRYQLPVLVVAPARVTVVKVDPARVQVSVR